MKQPPALNVWLQLIKESGFDYVMLRIAEITFKKEEPVTGVESLLCEWICEDSTKQRYQYCIQEIINYFEVGK